MNNKNMHKVFLFIVLMFGTISAYGNDGTYTAGGNPNPVYMKLHPVPKTTPEQLKCMRRVLMKIGAQTYEVSRIRSLRYTTAGGQYITDKAPDHPAIDCNIVDVGQVKSVSTGYKNWKDIDIEITDIDPKAPNMFVTTYAKSKDVIDDMTKSLLYKKLPDGTRKFIWDKVVLYQLPKEILKTYNGEPVIVYCRTKQEDPKNNICNSKYIHPDGIGFGYSYLERKDKESDHFGLDIVACKRLREMKHVEAAANPAPVPAATPAPAPAPSPGQ